jgi:large subunit ribosomal protein L25
MRGSARAAKVAKTKASSWWTRYHWVLSGEGQNPASVLRSASPMTRPKLSVQPRAIQGKEVARLRRAGRLPGVIYGLGQDSQPIEVDAHEFELLHRQTGRHAVVDLHLDGSKPKPVLLHAIQEHPLTRKPIHVDFLAVNMEEERTVDVPIVAVGESEAIDRMGGVLLHLRDTVLVRSKPDDLPSSLELDISRLVDFETTLHASDLNMPEGVTLVTEESEALVRVQAPRLEEAEEPTPEAEGGETTAEAGEAGEAESSGESSGGSTES